MRFRPPRRGRTSRYELGMGVGLGSYGATQSFTPLSLAPSLWLDASVASSLFQNSNGTTAATADGDPVGYWADLSGNARHVTQATGTARPLYIANAFNGYPGIRHDFTDDFLENAAFNAISGLSAATIAIVTQSDTGNAAGVFSPVGDAMTTYQWSGVKVRCAIGGIGTYGEITDDRSKSCKLLIWVYDGTQTGNANRLKLWRNGIQRSLTFAGTIPATLPASTGAYVGRYQGGGNFLNGDMLAVVVAPRAISEGGELASLNAYYAGTTFANLPSSVIADGDSLTAGAGSTAGNDYPSQLADLLGSGWTKQFNLGVPGQQMAAILADYRTQVSEYRQSYRPRDVVLLWAGTNDLYAGRTAADTYADLTTYCQAVMAEDGFQCYLGTCIPRNDTPPGGYEAERASLNTLIRANTAGATGVMDFAADARLTNTADTTYFNADTVHLTDAGYGVVAGIACSAVAP